MARSPRSINAPSAVTPLNVKTSTPTPAVTTRTRTRHSLAAAVTPTANASSSGTRSSSRSGSTPAPSASTPSTPSQGADVKAAAKSAAVEAKAHGLRSIQGERERVNSPFPGEYGGREKCGVSEEDERDDVLMAACSACARLDNRALSADEMAAIAIEEGWLRAPSAAVVPATIINNAIRAHQKRAAAAQPPRPTLLNKYQLAGSVNESVLEPALHPSAFSGPNRPKGTVWYLVHCGKTRWKNPFQGIDIPKMPARKPGPPKKLKEVRPKPPAQTKTKSKSATPSAAPSSAAAPVKIRLVVGNQNPDEEDAASDAGASSAGSRPQSRRGSMTPQLPSTTPAPIPIARKSSGRKIRNIADSSDESDTSDSDMDMDASAVRMARPIKARKERPPPLPLPGHNTSRHSIPAHLSRSLGSPFLDWNSTGLPPSPTLSSAMLPQPHSSPFPSHSLDNTTWTHRHDLDRFATLETSSSSSDDEMREPGDWGMSSSILIRGTEEDEVKPLWSVEDEEAKVKEATDALRVLFPMSAEDDDVESDDNNQLNRLDNRPTPSDTSSVAESAATATVFRGPLKSAELSSSLALTAWNGQSSPVASPNLRSASHLLPSTVDSPTQHLSRLNHSFDANDIEMDMDDWYEDGPVKADDSDGEYLDADSTSNLGDIATPEHDKKLHTAAWALEAAVSTSFRVKEEVADYPSPLTTESDEVSAADYRASRASSSESHTPSSGLSELPPYEETEVKPDIEEMMVGPESISMEELDGWMSSLARTEKTPQRSRTVRKPRNDPSRSSGSWGGIGVGSCTSQVPPAQSTKSAPAAPVRRPSGRSGRRRRSSTRTPQTARSGPDAPPTPPADTEIPIIQLAGDYDMDCDAIGPDDLEAACAEAEAREEKHRRHCREKAEKQRALLEAYKLKVREAQTAGRAPTDISPPAGWDRVSPWSEATSGPWGSTDSLSVQTPSALSPMALHMSALSLDTPMYGSMNPTALISPPLLPSAVGMMEEVLSQKEVDAVMSAVNTPAQPSPHPPVTSPKSTSATPVPIAPMPASGAPMQGARPAHIGQGNAKSAAPAVRAIAPATSEPQRKSPGSHGAAATASQALSTAASTPIPVPIATASAPVSRVTTPPNPIDPKKKPISPATAVSTPSSTASMPPPAKAPAKGGVHITKITKTLCPGIDACVVDNIPVYSHVWEDNGAKTTLLRRLDSDFVNATALLTALGLNTAQVAARLQETTTPWSQNRHLNSSVCPTNGKIHSSGVAGVWVHFAEALELVKSFKKHEERLMSTILKEDLFQMFAILANIKQEHLIPEKFGLPFIAGLPAQPTSQSTAQNSSLSASSTNSKSTPNLTSLSTSATAQQGRSAVAAPLSKGPLVRPAPLAVPEGCPQPKRRRATMSIGGDISPMSPMTPAGTGPPAVAKKPPARATRASIAGDTPKPKVTK